MPPNRPLPPTRGRRELTLADRLDEENREQHDCAVLLYDGFVTLSVGKTDAIIIEIVVYGAGQRVALALPYRHAADARGFGVKPTAASSCGIIRIWLPQRTRRSLGRRINLGGHMQMIVIAVACSVAFASPSFAQQCLSAGAESPDQAVRRREALSAARLVNTLQANQPGAAQRRYLRHEELAAAAPGLPATFTLVAGEDIVPGWKLTLDVTPTGYWFAIEDSADPCGFRYISNEQGLIFAAEPLR